MALKPGDVFEAGIWMDGRETEEMKKAWENDFREALAELPVISGPLIMTELRPGDERVPKVPDGLQGPDVRFLVGEALIVDLLTPDDGNFLADLDPKDLERLVVITRRIYQEWNPGKPEWPLEKCYENINRLGPDAAIEALRDESKVH